MRTTKATGSKPITPETWEKLIAAIDSVNPGKWWRTLEVCPVAVVHSIDNEADAIETILRIENRARGNV